MRELTASLAETGGGAPAGQAHLTAAHPGHGRARLGAMRRGAHGVVVGIEVPAGRAHAIEAHELERRLLEMGFVEGAYVEILHEGPVGRDPIAVKLDDARIALRRRDADALIVATAQVAHPE
jgi:ferrous iron transport protein A